MRRYFRKPHRKSGRRSKPISLLSGEIDLVQKAGGPTFAPLSGGRFRCNQLPYKGRLTRGQVVGIREACAFRGTREEKKNKVVIRSKPPRTVFSTRQSYDRCLEAASGRRRMLPLARTSPLFW
jgi:hypothetical protein